MSDDELTDLAARIHRFEQARPAPTAIQERPTMPAKTIISPREKAIRRWLLVAILGWCGLIYVWILVLRWDEASVLELGLGAILALVCAFGCYGFFLVYIELGKRIWRTLRPRMSGNSKLT